MALVDRAARSLTTTLLAILVLAALAVAAGRALHLTVTGSIALYFVVWWTVLFAILPVRIRTQAEAGEVTEGSDPGAPAAPALRERAIWTTIVSLLVFVALVVFLPLGGL
ncbi:MAG: hypothetical protein JWR08_2070 [Enterovirga sp.]|jgi:predicted secreted protein|nr:hypothetical protein [Enterovirga sp.]